MSRARIRLAALAVVAVPAVLGTASPASAAESSFTRETDFFGIAFFLEEQDTAANGNVHLGQLYAEETAAGRARVTGFIEDYDCPAGVYPDLLDPANGCALVRSQSLQGTDLTFTVARKASSARLTGSLTASTGDVPGTSEDEGGEALGSAPVDMTWTATGEPDRIRTRYRFRDPETGSVTTERTRIIRRLTSLSGRLGPVTLTGARTADGMLDLVRTTSRFRS